MYDADWCLESDVVTDLGLKVHRLVQQLSTVRNEKARLRKETNLKKRAVYLKKKAEAEEKSAQNRKESMKEVYRRQGKEEKRAAFAAEGRYGPSSKKRRGNDD